ncbi:MAG: UDP-N-acetylmuramoyl-tripeptide--D-alanyl-D-alanine ligase [Bacillota bacterium]|nr:UDP-N-acetylmuramoyl-tripeptide--D-alanyl-D-alanine ligase [Bacillota bacterium]
MEPLRLTEVLYAVNGQLLKGNPETIITGVTTDSRNVAPGQLFFAFPGARVDGHSFVADALQSGAAGAVISKPILINTRHPLILVPDPYQALQNLAKYYRTLFQVPVIAVTGSTGKTTTKDLIAGVLATRLSVLKTEGNQNNEIGLPLTILRITRQHGAVVLEMAMRGRGEIGELCRISRPDVGVITNIGKTHLETLGTEAAIAEAKGELLAALPLEGCAVLNGQDPWQVSLARQFQGNLLFYGEDQRFPVYALHVKLRGLKGISFLLRTPRGESSCFLPLPGRHNVFNALAAAAVGHWFGLMPEEIAQGLASASVTGMRIEVKDGSGGSKIIDDTYNASPASVIAGLQLLASVPRKGRAVAVLGDMYELGWYTVQGHREVGRAAGELKVDYLFVVGDYAGEIAQGAREAGMDQERIKVFSDKTAALAFLSEFLEPGDLVLVKGSRAMRMEEIVAGICDQVISHG